MPAGSGEQEAGRPEGPAIRVRQGVQVPAGQQARTRGRVAGHGMLHGQRDAKVATAVEGIPHRRRGGLG